jgi:LPXTG-motif cell wall-anchored protein
MRMYMKNMFMPLVLLLALSVPALAQIPPGGGGGGGVPPSGGGVKGAPGPLVGAGLPVLLIGGGIYWIVRRRKRATPPS